MKRIRMKLYKRQALNAFVEGRFSRAYQSFRKVLEINPREQGMSYNMGLVCIALKRYEEAERWLSESPGESNPGIFRTMADLYYLWGKRDKAVSWYQKARNTGMEKNLVDARLKVLDDDKEYKAAMESYDLLNQGVEAMKKKEWEQAVSLLRRAVRADKTNYIALNNLGTILMNRNMDLKEAEKCFKKADRLVDNPVISQNLNRIRSQRRAK